MAVSRHLLEREVKFAVEPEFSLRRLPGIRLPRQVFTSTYYDTEDHRLLQAGLTVRHRTNARSGSWQLKVPVDDARLEVEFPGNRRDPPQALTRVLQAHLRGKSVRPIVRMRTHRRGIEVRENRGSVAVTLDAVDVLEGGKAVRHFEEVEAELVAGDEKALRRVARTLKKGGAKKTDQRPKVLRALGLSFAPPDGRGSRSFPPVEHLKALVKRELTNLLVRDVGVRLRAASEDLHQMRVTTRRLRAVLRAARARMLDVDWVERLRAELSALGTSLGAVRDLDVLLAHLRKERSNLPERVALRRVLDAVEDERQARRRALLEMLGSDRYRVLLEHLEAATIAPVVTDPHASLERIAGEEFAKLRRAVRKAGAKPSDAQLHRIRIATKRARYAAELAEAVRGKSATRFIERVKGLQDVLGEHHDAVIAEQMLRTVLAPDGDPKTAVVVGRLIERQGERRREARDALPKAWSKVKKCGRVAWRRG
jgi:CHAD domain-containing protein